MKIAIVSTDSELGDALLALMKQSGYEAAVVDKSGDFSDFDAAVVDSDFAPPCRHIRLITAGDSMPIGSEIMTKPLVFGALMQWLESGGNSETLISGAVLDKTRRTITGDNSTASLTDKEMELLSVLLEHGNEGIERKKLLAMVWGYGENVETTTLETHIYRLRRVFQEAGVAASITLQSGIVRLEISEHRE